MTVSNTRNISAWQLPEKLIPTILLNAAGENPPVHGDGAYQRDWLFVEGHAISLLEMFNRGVPGETFAIGARQP